MIARQPPGRIGRFLLHEPLGEGGYGQVFRAYDPHLEREVALKILKPHRLNEKSLERFFRESRAAARLDHPNIVGLHDAGRDEGRCWIAYQLVAGQTLSMFRDLERPSIETSVRIVRDLALALDHAHGRGVFHRDLKPANVLIDESGRARLTDFGLARRDDVESDLTVEGTVLGTPQYMSPEAAAGRAHEADGRSDVYSLGVILYELICGKRPSEVPSGASLWRSTKMAAPPTPRSVDRTIPLDLDRICMKALAFDPDGRFADARTLADALTSSMNHGPTVDPRVRKVAKEVGLVAGICLFISIFSLVLGKSFHVASPETNWEKQALPLLASAKVKAAPKQAATAGSGVAKEPRTREPIKFARKPISDGPTNLASPWDQPVVWITGTTGSKFHLASGCQSTREIPRSRWVELGQARAAKDAGYRPCGHCLKAMGQLGPPPPILP